MIEIKENYSLKNHSTFRIGGIVEKIAFPETIDELVILLKSKEYDIVLGNCSNVLFSSDKINKKIILTNKIDSFSFNGNKLNVCCGAKGPIISNECKNRNLSGFEFMIGFPASFGGMICMNASAHNQAISDTFLSAKVYNLKTNNIETFTKEEMNFSYRNSKLSCGNYIVLEAEFLLKDGKQEQITELMDRNTEFRKTRQPSLKYGNAGSIFKNPENDSAGRLLDLCEMKGEKEGGAEVFEKHANFILNKNNATSKDVLTLMYKMYSKVREKYTIELQPEVKYIGDEGTQEYKLWKIMTENIQTTQK